MKEERERKAVSYRIYRQHHENTHTDMNTKCLEH